jgi:hypothetical protein
LKIPNTKKGWLSDSSSRAPNNYETLSSNSNTTKKKKRKEKKRKEKAC